MNEPEAYQGMSLAVVANLLALAQTYHQGFVPGEAQVRAFHDVAVRYRWTADETERAIRKWGADRGRDDWLDPALLNRMIRDARQDRMSREAAPSAARPMTVSRDEWRHALVAAWSHSSMFGRELNAQIRATVAQFPDLVERFEAGPIPMSFEKWTGWYPPDSTALGYPNPSPYAAKIREIAQEACERSGLTRHWREERRAAHQEELLKMAREGL